MILSGIIANRWRDKAVSLLAMKRDVALIQPGISPQTIHHDWDSWSLKKKSMQLAMFVIQNVTNTPPGYRFLSKDNASFADPSCLLGNIASVIRTRSMKNNKAIKRREVISQCEASFDPQQVRDVDNRCDTTLGSVINSIMLLPSVQERLIFSVFSKVLGISFPRDFQIQAVLDLMSVKKFL